MGPGARHGANEKPSSSPDWRETYLKAGATDKGTASFFSRLS